MWVMGCVVGDARALPVEDALCCACGTRPAEAGYYGLCEGCWVRIIEEPESPLASQHDTWEEHGGQR